MLKDEVLKKLEQIRNLPTLPAVIDRLGTAVKDPRMDASRIATIIKDDPSMMARILKVVNSSIYAAAEPITSIQQAVARMGLNVVNNIALSTSVFSTLNEGNEAGFDKTGFWQHCIATGVAAQVINQKTRGTLRKTYDKETLHLAGLLHDIGKIIFAQYFQDAFKQAIQDCRDRHIPLFVVEQEAIHADHAQVGHWLAKKWNLSPLLADVVRWHHEPDNAAESHRPLTLICHCANYISNIGNIGMSGDSVAPAFYPSVWNRLGLSKDDIPALTEQVVAQASASEVWLSFV